MQAGVLTRLRQSTSGNVSMLMAGGLMMMSGAAALGVDTASLYLAKRNAQGIADAAALAAAVEPASARSRAQRAIDDNAMRGLRLVETQAGTYSPDMRIAADQRFVVGGTNPNGATVLVEAEVETYFARIFGMRNATVRARSKASRVNLAAFSIGTRVAALSGGLPNAILSQLAGTELQLTAVDYNGLASARLDLLGLTEAVRAEADLTSPIFADVLGSRITLPDLLNAMAVVVRTPSAASTLRMLAGRVNNDQLQLSALIDLGPLKTLESADPHRTIDVDALSLLRAVLETTGANRRVQADVGLNLPGISASTVQLAFGARPSSSPWLTVGQGNEVTVRTAQTRLYLEARLLPSLLPGLTGLRVPIYLELAGASATLANIGCSQGRDRPTAALDVVPSVARVAIADINASALNDFTRAVTTRPATVAGITGVLAVTAEADVPVGSPTAQRVNFTTSDITGHSPRTVSSNDIGQGLATSLTSRARLDAQLLGLPLSVSPVLSSVGTLLGTVSPALDDLLSQVLALTGLNVGQADTWMNGVRCGTPILVA